MRISYNCCAVFWMMPHGVQYVFNFFFLSTKKISFFYFFHCLFCIHVLLYIYYKVNWCNFIWLFITSLHFKFQYNNAFINFFTANTINIIILKTNNNIKLQYGKIFFYRFCGPKANIFWSSVIFYVNRCNLHSQQSSKFKTVKVVQKLVSFQQLKKHLIYKKIISIKTLNIYFK